MTPSLIDDLKRNAQKHPQKTALIYQDQHITYQMLLERSAALACHLRDFGLEKGQTVGLMLNKTPEVIISFLGTLLAGGVAFPIDFNQPPGQLQYLFELTRPHTLILADEYRSLLAAVPHAEQSRQILVGKACAEESASQFEAITRATTVKPPEVSLAPGDTAYLNLTSGTTGTPKCAVTTYENIYWNTRSAVEALKLTPDDVHLCMFAVFAHPHELVARPLYLGGTMVLLDRISPKSVARAIIDNQVTCVMAIASVYETLVRLYDAAPFKLEALRIPESGGMHTSPTLAQSFQKRFRIPIIPVWGSTEACGIALASPIGQPVRPASVGKPCPYYDVKLLDDEGREVPTGVIGQMAVRGKAVVSEYLGNPVETERHLKDGWFLTGDMMSRDSDGYHYFTGRSSGMMKVAGLKVYPVEIEDILLAHPQIAEAAVVKHQDSLHGEVPRAVIVLKNGTAIGKKDIRAYCEKSLSRYKVPRVIEFRDKLPRSPGGKILWRDL